MKTLKSKGDRIALCNKPLCISLVISWFTIILVVHPENNEAINERIPLGRFLFSKESSFGKDGLLRYKNVFKLFLEKQWSHLFIYLLYFLDYREHCNVNSIFLKILSI